MKVLIIKLGALGDMIIASPIIRQVLRHHEADSVHLMTTTPYKDLFSEWQKLKVYPMQRGGFFETIGQIQWIRKQGFQRIYDLQSNDRSSILCALSGVPYRAGNHPRIPYHVHPETEFMGQCHSFERLNEIIEAAGITKAEPAPCLPVTESCEAQVHNWLSEQGLEAGGFVILHAGSSHQHKQKRWPYFDKLAVELYNKGKAIVWIGGEDDTVLNHQLSQTVGIDASNLFSIAELVALGKHAAFAVTNDSAPMHILSCCGIPVFGLFGPTNPQRTHALAQANRVICPRGNIPLNDQEFEPAEISLIKQEDVLERINAESLL